MCCSHAIGNKALSNTGLLYSFFWMMTIARGITGVGVGGEYPSVSHDELED